MAVVRGPRMHLSILIQSGQRCLLSKIFAPLDIKFTALFVRVSSGDHRVSDDCIIENVEILINKGLEVQKWNSELLSRYAISLMPMPMLISYR